MSAILRDTSMPAFLAPKCLFDFNCLPEIHAEAPASYEMARFEINAREAAMGAAWYRHNAELAWQFWQAKKPWWL